MPEFKASNGRSVEDTWMLTLETDAYPVVLDTAGIVRCMRSAARKGFDPYNSHTTQDKCFARAWSDKARRSI